MAVVAQTEHFAVPVLRRTPEWGWLEYLLQVSCQTWRLRLRAGWSVANKQLAADFGLRCRGLNQLHAWVPVADLPENVSVQEICQHGFSMDHAGVSFHIGNVDLPSLSNDRSTARGGQGVRNRGRSLPAGRRLFEFLLCRVGVGRSLLVENAAQAETLDMPPEYDSFFIRHNQPGATDSREKPDDSAVLPRHMLHHEYVVRDAAQALPLYLVHFEYDPAAAEKLELPLCDNCGVRAAVLYCEADDASFCKSCDAQVHSVNSIAAKHMRVPLNRRPNMSSGSCPDHPDTDADQYCLEDKIPICRNCRSFGSHSAGAALKHQCVPIFEAYDEALRSNSHLEQEGLPDRDYLEQQVVAVLDRKLVEVQQAGKTAEDRIYDHVQQAVKQGQELAEEQALLFLADGLEAKRQLDEAAWLEAFFEEEVKALPPSDFLAAWVRHCALREQVAELGRLGPSRASAGLRLEGGLRLRAEVGAAGASIQHAPPERWALDG